MNTTGRTVSRITLAFAAAAILTFGTGSKAQIGPATPATSIASTKGDRLCGADHWPPTEAACLRSVMAKSGRGVSMRLVGERTAVVERPMTDRERLEAAFSTFETRIRLADRM
jgi:hypothetical protein